jgi:hypothetical protein
MGDSYPRTGGYERRLIDLRREDPHSAVGWLEDDFHHFGVTIEYDEAGIITGVRASAPRFPYTTCPGAALALRGMIGHALSPRASDVGRMIPMRHNCTHMFDLAGLTMALAASGRTHKRYQATVTDRPIVGWEGMRRVLGPGSATLWLDDKIVLEWQIDQRIITGPTDWRGQSLNEGFRQTTEAMSIEEAECANVLRRVVMIASGRSMDPDLHPLARDRGQGAVCHTFLEENRDHAVRVKGSTLNYETSAEGMLAQLPEKP